MCVLQYSCRLRDYDRTGIIEAGHTRDFLKKYECFPYSEAFCTETPGYEGRPVRIGGCALHNSSSVSWRNSQRRNLFLEQGTCCWLPDILSCWRIQKWCLTAAGPTPTLWPRGMCPVWATVPAIKAVTVGRGKASSPVLGLSFPWKKKESVLTWGFPPRALPLSPNPPAYRRRLIVLPYSCFFFGSTPPRTWR